MLYDAVGTIAEALGGQLVNDEYLKLLLPPLLAKWDALKDDDTGLFPLLECLNCVAVALGPAFTPYASTIFGRCLKLIEAVLVQSALAQQDERIEPPNREFLICSLDLISGLFEALHGGMEPIVNGSKLIPLLLETCKDGTPDYCQSAFALVGDIARHCIEQLKPAAAQFIPLLLKGMVPTYVGACNNAIWATGEILMKVNSPQLLDQFGETILSRFLIVFFEEEGETVQQTTAVAIARIGIFRPQFVAPHLPKLIRSMCHAFRCLSDDVEKEDGLRGLCEIVKLNPHAVLPQFHAFCEAIASYDDEPPESSKALYGSILHGFKSIIPPGLWEQIFAGFSKIKASTLRSTYNL